MKMHSNTVGTRAVYEAARIARSHGQDILVEDAIECGSRSRAKGVTFYCESDHGRRSRNGRGGLAASWTAYGYLIAALFARDREAIIGHYNGVDHFEEECRAEGRRRGESIDFIDFLAVATF